MTTNTRAQNKRTIPGADCETSNVTGRCGKPDEKANWRRKRTGLESEPDRKANWRCDRCNGEGRPRYTTDVYVRTEAGLGQDRARLGLD